MKAEVEILFELNNACGGCGGEIKWANPCGFGWQGTCRKCGWRGGGLRCIGVNEEVLGTPTHGRAVILLGGSRRVFGEAAKGILAEWKKQQQLQPPEKTKARVRR